MSITHIRSFARLAKTIHDDCKLWLSTIFLIMGMVGNTNTAEAAEPGSVARSIVGGQAIEKAHPELKDRFELMKQARLADYYRHTVSPEKLHQDAVLIALNIYHEARGEGRDGWRAVAQVTLNRVISRRYPDTIEGVVTQRKKVHNRYVCQFSWYCDRKSDAIDNDLKEMARFANMVEIAKRMLTNVESDPTNGSLHYHADYVSPRWARGKTPVVCIATHCFYNNVS